jgi:integrase
MGRGDLTVHGFRSTFRVWVAERTLFPSEIAEAALAHSVPNQVERAYKRTDFFERRRKLMEQWATFCTTPPAQETPSNVAPMRRMG